MYVKDTVFFFTTLAAAIHYNQRSVVDSRKVEGYVYEENHSSILNL